MKKFVLLAANILFSLFFFSTKSDAQVPGKQVPIKVPITQSAPNSLIYLPWDYDISGKNYSLLCFFHGLGEAGTDLNRLRSQGLPQLIDQGHAPYSVNKQGDTTWFIVFSLQFVKADYYNPGAKEIKAAIQTLINDYHLRIDQNRIYPVGLSQGGNYSLWSIQNEPDLFPAAVPMSPSVPINESKIDNFKNTHIWLFVGTSDAARFLSTSYGANTKINAKYPGHSRLTTYSGGHCCWNNFFIPTYRDSLGMNIYDWLLQYKLGSNDGDPGANTATANAGSDITITLPKDSVMLDGSASTGTIESWNWAKKSGPDSYKIRQEGNKAYITDLTEGAYVFTLTIKDPNGTASWDDVSVTVKADPNAGKVVAIAGTDRTITLPKDSVILDGSASTGPVTNWSWTKKSGSNANIQQNSSKAAITGLLEGTYVFTLTVKNANGDASSDEVTVMVNPDPATLQVVAHAGYNRVVTLPKDSVILDGSASTGPITNWSWAKKSGSSAEIQQEGAIAKISNLQEGTYVFTLTVKNASGDASSDEVTVTVNPAPDESPVTAIAGVDRVITLPKDTLILDGSASSGPVDSWSWAKKSGPDAEIQQRGSIANISGLVAGEYIFTLTVKNSAGDVSWDDVAVKVNPDPATLQVVANAGDNRVITLPKDSVILDGSTSSGPITNWSWTKKSGPDAEIQQEGAIAKISNLQEGTYVFTLTVKNASGDASSDEVTVTVNPDPATLQVAANAGDNRVVTLPKDSVILDGSASTGSITNWSWAKKSGSRAEIQQEGAIAKISNLQEGTYVFTLTVKNASGDASSDEVTVTVNPAPDESPVVAVAGIDRVITLPKDTLILDGSASSGPVDSWSWAKKSGPDAEIQQRGSIANISGLVAGEYIFTLTVKNSAGDVSWDDVAVKVNPDPATLQVAANAGSDRTITLPKDSVILDGSASTGPITNWSWTKKSGPDAEIQQEGAIVKISNLQEGTYVFALTVKNASGDASSDEVTVTVNPDPATLQVVANAGYNRVVTLPKDSVILDGSASTGPITNWSWTKKSGPDAEIQQEGAIAKISNLQEGTYVFTLTVKNASGDASSDEVTVTVNPDPASLQVVSIAGDNRVVTLPKDSVILDGSASTGPITSWSWTKKSESGAEIQQEGAIAKISSLQEGTYVFTLTVKNANGDASSDEVTVTVNPDPASLQVVSIAGDNRVITLPKDSVVLDGSDSSGPITNWSWTKKSGPDAEIQQEDAIAKISNLQEGTYVFTLTVKNASGDASSDEVTVTVNPDPNVLGDINNPIADAGEDLFVTLPVNKVTLDATAGTEAKNKPGGAYFYSWVVISGPSEGKFNKPGKGITDFSDLVSGVYTLELSFRINQGSTAKDTVLVTVYPDVTAPGDVPFNANTLVKPYNEAFQYGSNMGYYGSGWNDTTLASIGLKAGIHTLRPTLPDDFMGKWGWDVRKSEFAHYTDRLGIKEMTLFVEKPRSSYAETGTKVFKNLYEPIWDQGENGTPINENNYFALYIYNLVIRYGKHVRFWEIVNEPDMTGFWDNGNRTRADNWWENVPKPSQLLNLKAPFFSYVRMLRVAYEVIKKYEPGAYVTPGGIGYPAFLDALLRYTDNPDGGTVTSEYPNTGGAYFDVVSYHIYPAYSFKVWDGSIQGFRDLRFSDRGADAIIDLKGEFEKVLTDRGYNGIQYPQKHFILTETNLPRKAFTDYYGGEEIQRNFMIKALVKAQMNNIEQFYVYGIGESKNYNEAKSAYELMGLYENLNQATYGQEKLVGEGQAFKTTSMLLYNWKYDAARTNLLSLPANIEGAAFKKGNEYRYVLWARTTKDRSEEAAATYSFPQSLNLTKLYRYNWNYSADPSAKGEVDPANVSLTGAPIFLAESQIGNEENIPPVANAGDDQTIILPINTATLNASQSSDPDGNIVSYLWTMVSGPSQATIQNQNSESAKTTGLVEGTYVFQVEVKDNRGASAKATTKVIVNPKGNEPPVADAGKNLSITLPTNSVTLDGGLSRDPDGKISSFLWTQVSGPSAANIENKNSESTKVSGLREGNYTFQLEVKDNNGVAAVDQVKVSVSAITNLSPIADAGNDREITLPTNSVSLDGSKSNDPDGSISTFQWSQVSGPNQAVIEKNNSKTTNVTGLVQGSYVFRLEVKDNSGATSSANVTITVRQQENKAPDADAGPDREVILPENTVLLDGSKSKDADGTITSYKWSQISGPNQSLIDNPNSASTQIFDLIEGAYTFRLEIKDNEGATATDNIKVTVRKKENQYPVANAGADIEITLPANSVSLDGSRSDDPDGTITSYQWSQISGPNQANIGNANTASANATNLVEGNYVFQLEIKDNEGASAAATVKVTVNPRQNQVPSADAGSNQEITLPVNSVTLDGSKSNDPDGEITSYVWVQVSGPNKTAIKSPNSATTEISGLTEGEYTFNLQVKDNEGATASANVKVTVRPKENQSPNADAGSNQEITLPTNSVTLNGSGSSDPDGRIVSYLWSQKSGPAQGFIENSNAPVTNVSGLVAGNYQFQLIVKDNDGESSTALVSIAVYPIGNQSPTANAGSDQTIFLPENSVLLDGSASNDPDGSLVAYTWSQVSGPNTAKIENPNASSTRITELIRGSYVFRLTVKDNEGATSTASVRITVQDRNNKQPVANAGGDQIVVLPSNSVALDGSKSEDPDGNIASYQWSQVSGPSSISFESANSAVTEVLRLVRGTYIFELTVRDNDGATATDRVTVTVNPLVNQVPVADAGENQVIVLPTNNVTLSGAGSLDSDGNIVSYNWLQFSGPNTAKIETPNSETTNVSELTGGSYIFLLVVRDNDGATASASVNVKVQSKASLSPIANAGSDQIITLPANSISLDGSQSSDPDGDIVSYSWVQTSGPAGATLEDAKKSVTKVSGLTEGIYQFRLTIIDNDGNYASDQIKISVLPQSNLAPTANAGSDQTTILPVSSVTLDGTGSKDADGTIESYSWTQVYGPNEAVFQNKNSSQTVVSGLVQGNYQFRLEVKDNDGAYASATVKVSVKARPNQSPVVNAGKNQTITLPVSSVTLDGTGSTDPDGTIKTYSWTQIDGPDQVIIQDRNSSTTTASGLVEGVYQFQLEVMDNDGAYASSTVQITVRPKPNQAPTANAGKDREITLPTNSVTLDGSLSKDDDGSIETYTWTRISGPNRPIIANPNSKSTKVIALIQGTYIFQLEVKDNNGAYATATVKVRVNPNPNLAPTANAGNDREITLPENSLTLDGSKSSDPDGSIASYEWTQISGPQQAVIASPKAKSTLISELVEGDYAFRLEIKDDKGAAASAMVKVTVRPRTNQTPTANAGSDREITLPENSLTLDGSKSSDPDGSIASYEWTQISGPQQAVITSPKAKSTLVSELVEGDYAFRLEVKDDKGAAASATVKVTVRPRTNQAPTANAGSDREITTQENSVFLDGSQSSDPDGEIVAYQWAQTSGPIHTVVESPNAQSTNVVNLIEGTYDFILVVTDNDGATSEDRVTVVVKPFVNQAPTANAGQDQYITYLENAHITLDGTQSFDQDGVITGYNWELVSGPSEISIKDPANITTEITGMQVGDYIFKLTVTDNYDLSSEAMVTVHVMPNYDAEIEVYPNPVRGSTLNVKIIGQTNSKSLFRIIDVNGRVVKEVQNDEILFETTRKINITDLHSGPYFIQLIEVGRIIGVKKFIRL